MQDREHFRAWATQEGQPPIQLSFPIPEIVKLAEQSLGELLRRVGKVFIEEVLEAEAEKIAGPRSKVDQERHAYRWGTEQGYCVIDGQCSGSVGNGEGVPHCQTASEKQVS